MVRISEAWEKAGIGDLQPAKKPGRDTMQQQDESASAGNNENAEFLTVNGGTSQNGKWNERLFKAVNEDLVMPEVFKLLRSQILHPLNKRPVPRTLLVSSAAPKEGKSFVVANLGVSIAQGLDQHCLLVDCDLRRPSLTQMFGLASNRGLVDHLRDHADLGSLICKTSVSKLSMLPSGKPPVNPAELLGSARMRELHDELAGRYNDRLIIFDSPPVQVASESIVLAGMVDAVIVVIRQGGAGKAHIKQLLDTIGKERLLGVVFNAQRSNIVERSLMKGYGGYYQQR
jgi:protein-tyrosine kinase